MSSFWRIFSLEFLSFVRSKTLVMLTVACVGWVLTVPAFLKGDGTEDGYRELFVRYALGGVFVFLLIALMSSATGALARERSAKRLQLTLVRPVRYTIVILGKWLAHIAVGAIVLTAVSVALAMCLDVGRECAHVKKPILPPPRVEAEKLYERYKADDTQSPEFREWIAKTKKTDVMRILEGKIVDFPVTVPTNRVTAWKFDLSGRELVDVRVRLRFQSHFNMRTLALGEFELGECSGTISNQTRSVVVTRLSPGRGGDELRFRNDGRFDLLVNPRSDLDLLLPADSFLWNLIRADLVILAILALLVALGMFLSAALGRPVAMFVAMAIVFTSEVSPSAVDSYEGEAEAPLLDKIGLAVARVVSEVSRPVSSANPIEKLASDDCVEWRDVLRTLVLFGFAVPLALAFVSGYLLPRKRDDDFA